MTWSINDVTYAPGEVILHLRTFDGIDKPEIIRVRMTTLRAHALVGDVKRQAENAEQAQRTAKLALLSKKRQELEDLKRDVEKLAGEIITLDKAVP